MNWAECPGFKRLRFDTELKTFDGIMSLFMNTPDRVKSCGKKVIAVAPGSPAEPVYAAGAIAYDPFTWETIFHAVMNEGFDAVNDAVEAGLSNDFNPWTLISAGAAAAKRNRVPIDGYSTICGCSDDQVKKAWQAMAAASGSPLYFWETPRRAAEFSDWAAGFTVQELKQLFTWLGDQTGHKVTDDNLAAAIRLGNLLRQDIIEITRLQQASPAPMPSLEYYFLLSTLGDYLQDGEALHRRYQDLLVELNDRRERLASLPSAVSPKKSRVYWLGDETQEYQIFNILEDCGAVLVGCDTRFSFSYDLIREGGNPVDNLAAWIWNMPGNLPTAERMSLTIPRIREQKTDAVIIHSEIGARANPGAEKLVRDILKEETGLPVLSIETALPLKNLGKVQSQLRSFFGSTPVKS